MRKLHDMRPPPERQGARMRNNGGPTAGGPQDEGLRQPQGKNPRAATDEGNRPPPPMGE